MSDNWLRKKCERIWNIVNGPDAIPNPPMELKPWRDQSEYIDDINSSRYFGVHKLLLLSLAKLRQWDPSYWFLYRSRSLPSRNRALINEGIVFVRLFFFAFVLLLSQYVLDLRYWSVLVWILIALSVYIAFILIVYLLGVVFLREFYNEPYSTDRSLIFVLIHYVEITIAFAIMHRACTNFGCCKPPDVFDILYFSFVTSATLGYGDLAPHNFLGELLVILQIIVMLLFAVVFLNHFSTARHKRSEL